MTNTPKTRRLGQTLRVSDGLADIKEQDRFRHCYIVGKTRVGKTAFLANLISHELEDCCLVLDPVGGLADTVSALAPKDRLVLIDKNHPAVINPLDRNAPWAESAKELVEVINACITATTSSPESTVLMGEILLHAVKVLETKHIEALSDLLTYEAERAKHHNDKYWKAFDARDLKGWLINKEKVDSAKRIAARLSAFFIDPALKKFTVGRNAFDVNEFVLKRKIVVVNLRGFDDGAKIYLGNLITHAVKTYYTHQATETSPALYFYIDEFHSFLTPFFDEMLAQSAKFNISINLAHQSHSQVTKGTLNAILGNCYTKVVFSCGYEEAERMAKEMNIRTQEISKIGKYQAVIGIGNKAHLVRTYPPPLAAEPAEPYFLSNDWIMVN